MTRCPNCYNSITPDTQNCPSCAYLLIRSEKTPISALSASAAPARASGGLQTATQVRSSGRLQSPDTARTSGRLRAPEQEPSSLEQTQRGANGEARANGNHRPRPTTRRSSRKDARNVRHHESTLRKKIVLIPVIVIGLGVAAYLLAPVAKLIAPEVDAETSVSTLTTFRSQPSRQPGKTVDRCVNEWIDESRKAGDLVAFSGWSTRPIKFDTGKIVIGFSFTDKGGVRMAEWLADVHKNTFIPRNDLAAQVYENK